MYAGFVIVLVSVPSPTVSVTVYVPAAVYVCVGLIAVLVPPSPKSHWLVVKSPAELLANCTVSGGAPAWGPR